jgi:hypothetical protein
MYWSGGVSTNTPMRLWMACYLPQLNIVQPDGSANIPKAPELVFVDHESTSAAAGLLKLE